MRPNAIRLHPHDNVVTVLEAVDEGDIVAWTDGVPLEARQAVPVGHEVALAAIPRGEVIRKSGHPIGRAGTSIAPGDHVHSHNLATLEGESRNDE